jgi:hypothetical protein
MTTWRLPLSFTRPELHPARALLTPTWLLALVVLALNDHLLKGAGLLPGAVTGKLSDLAGMLVAPVLLAVAPARPLAPRPAPVPRRGRGRVRRHQPVARRRRRLVRAHGPRVAVARHRRPHRPPRPPRARARLARARPRDDPPAARRSRRSPRASPRPPPSPSAASSASPPARTRRPTATRARATGARSGPTPRRPPPPTSTTRTSRPTCTSTTPATADIRVRTRGLLQDVQLDCIAVERTRACCCRRRCSARARPCPAAEHQRRRPRPDRDPRVSSPCASRATPFAARSCCSGGPATSRSRSSTATSTTSSSTPPAPCCSPRRRPAVSRPSRAARSCSPSTTSRRRTRCTPAPTSSASPGATRRSASTSCSTVEVGPDGCVAATVDGSDARWYLCVPEGAFPFAADQWVRVDDNFGAIDIRRVPDPQDPIAVPFTQLTLSRGGLLPTLEDVVLAASTDYDAVLAPEPTCGTVASPVDVSARYQGGEVVHLRAGDQAALAGQDRGLTLWVAHAEERVVLDPTCALGPDQLGGRHRGRRAHHHHRALRNIAMKTLTFTHTSQILLALPLLGLPACGDSGSDAYGDDGGGSATSPGSGGDENGDDGGSGLGVGQGGSQDFGQFKDILDQGGIPGPNTIDDVGFFNEHKIELPNARVRQRGVPARPVRSDGQHDHRVGLHHGAGRHEHHRSTSSRRRAPAAQPEPGDRHQRLDAGRADRVCPPGPRADAGRARAGRPRPPRHVLDERARRGRGSRRRRAGADQRDRRDQGRRRDQHL